MTLWHMILFYQKYITMILLSNFFTWSTPKITFIAIVPIRCTLFFFKYLRAGLNFFFRIQSWNLELTTLSFLTLRLKRSREISKSLYSVTRRLLNRRSLRLGNTRLASLASGSARLQVDLKEVTSLAHLWLGRTICKYISIEITNSFIL